MNSVSPPITNDGFALTYRQCLPAPKQPSRLLVLLHGVGGNETNLAGLAAGVPDDTLVVLPRGPIQLGFDQYAWFRVAFTANGPRIEADAANASRLSLIAFVQQVQAAHGISPARTVIAGFSQGGILSASVALSAPDGVAGFGVLSGRILPELEPYLADRSSLSNLQGFIAHGRHDDKLPVDWAHRADDWLTRLGVAHETRLYPTGHVLDAAMLSGFHDWFANLEFRHALVAGHR